MHRKKWWEVVLLLLPVLFLTVLGTLIKAYGERTGHPYLTRSIISSVPPAEIRQYADEVTDTRVTLVIKRNSRSIYKSIFSSPAWRQDDLVVVNSHGDGILTVPTSGSVTVFGKKQDIGRFYYLGNDLYGVTYDLPLRAAQNSADALWLQMRLKDIEEKDNVPIAITVRQKHNGQDGIQRNLNRKEFGHPAHITERNPSKQMALRSRSLPGS